MHMSFDMAGPRRIVHKGAMNLDHPAEPGATRCLEIDHDRLDEIMLEVERAASGGQLPEAQARFTVFASGLVRHIEAEETVLFPMLETHQPGAGGPISVMLTEHEQFRELLEEIAALFAARSDQWEAAVRRLKEGLLAHNTKEERMLYPMSDEMARHERKVDELAVSLRAFLEATSGG